MNKMKRMMTLFLTLVLVVSLIGCGDKKKSGKDAEKEPEIEDCVGFEAVKALKEMKEADYTMYFDIGEKKGEITLSVRKNGLSLSVNSDDVKEVKGEVLRIVDNTVYCNLPKDAVDQLEKEYLSDDGLKGLMDELGLSVEAGWYSVFQLPDGVHASEYIYDLFQAAKETAADVMLNGKEDKEQITLDSSCKAVIEQACRDHAKKDLRPIAEKIQKDLQKVDYMGYVKDMYDANRDLLAKLVLPSLGGDYTVDSLWQMGVEMVSKLLGAQAENEINAKIYDLIAELNLNQMEEYVDEAEGTVITEDINEVFTVTCEDSIVKVTNSNAKGYVSVQANTDKLKAPEVKNDLAKCSLVAAVGVLVPSYIKYIEKSRSMTDVMAVYDMVLSAEMISVDVEYAIQEGTQFLLNYSNGLVTEAVQYNGQSLKEVADAWKERDAMEYGYLVKSSALDHLSDGYAVGTVAANGSLSWEIHGEFFEAIQNLREMFR